MCFKLSLSVLLATLMTIPAFAGPKSRANATQQNIEKLEINLKTVRLEKYRTEAKLEVSRAKIETYFEPSVSDFLLDGHIESAKLCSQYSGSANCSSESCNSHAAVPEILQNNWVKGKHYCIGSGRSDAGRVKDEICSDPSLLNSQISRRASAITECVSHLKRFIDNKIELSNLADKETQLSDEIEGQKSELSDLRESDVISRDSN